jgi:hypothetical protein
MNEPTPKAIEAAIVLAQTKAKSPQWWAAAELFLKEVFWADDTDCNQMAARVLAAEVERLKKAINMDQLAEKQKEIDRLRAALVSQIQKTRELQFDLKLIDYSIYLDKWTPFLKCEFYIDNMEDAHRFLKQYKYDPNVSDN